MNYLHVASMAENSKGGFCISPIVARQTGNCLYSLIEGLRQEDFGLHTVEIVAENIRQYREKYLQPVGGSIFTDSGGYSIIKGDVHPQDIRRFIKCYNAYVEHDRSLYEFVFSLDIPFSKRFPNLNTRKSILEHNRESLQDAKHMLTAHPELQDKFFFVWHFKMPSQYAIWEQLYSELALQDVIRNRAIGGMVGMRSVTGKSFSPFTGIAYRCLDDYLRAEDFSHPFRLHMLGMYIRYDRFQMALLEHLFQDYIGSLAQVQITYDSINYSHTMRMNKDQPWFLFNHDGLVVYPTLQEVPEGYLQNVYQDKKTLEFVQEEILRKSSKHKLQNINSFIPLNIQSNLFLDRFFEKVVVEQGLAEVVRQSSSPTVLQSRTHDILKTLSGEYPSIFTVRMNDSIVKNMLYTYEFNRWFSKGRSRESLDAMMQSFITMVGFPECIR